MRILYISGDNPAVDTILNGMDDSTLGGLPAFYYPFKMLLERGHTKAENLIQLHPKNGMLPGAVEYALQLTGAARSLLNERHYDFVYGMSEGAHLAVREAAKRGIPCGLRQFGTQEMANVLEPIRSVLLRRLKALKDYTYITLSMQSRKSFLLATDDGTDTGAVPGLLGIEALPYRFFLWHTGIEIPAEQPALGDGETYPAGYAPMVLSHIGRVTELKSQDRSLRILEQLHRKGYPFHLYFVGDIRSEAFHKELLAWAEEHGLEAYVHFTGFLNQKVCRAYARNSFMTLLTADFNGGNVFYEIMSEGALLLMLRDPSLDRYAENGVNCVVCGKEEYEQAAERILALMDKEDTQAAIRRAAYQTAREKFLSIEKRFGLEADLVEAAARGEDLSRFPETL